jgi:hypothetical protein
MVKQWEDKSQWITHCPICFCATTHQLLDFHIQYHENQVGQKAIDDTQQI